MNSFIPQQQGSWPNAFLSGVGKSNAQSSPDQPIKRGRGRPRKHPIASEAPAGQEAAPRRKRGRPPKNAVAQASTASAAMGGEVSDGIVTPPVNDVTPVKRKPGRPRKIVDPNQQPNPAEGVFKRGPGRPRKSDVKPGAAHPTPVAQNSVVNPFNHGEQTHTAALLQQKAYEYMDTDRGQPSNGESSRAVQAPVASAGAMVDPPKRGRGRPKGSKNIRRKADDGAETVSATNHAPVPGDPNAAAPVKRGPGRPRKSQPAPQAIPQPAPQAVSQPAPQAVSQPAPPTIPQPGPQPIPQAQQTRQENMFLPAFSSPDTSQMSSMKRPWSDSSERMTWVEVPGNPTPNFASAVKDEQQQVMQEILPPDGDSTPVKRPRGRPRKNPLPTPSGDPAPVKRGRGRPRKEERR